MIPSLFVIDEIYKSEISELKNSPRTYERRTFTMHNIYLK